MRTVLLCLLCSVYVVSTTSENNYEHEPAALVPALPRVPSHRMWEMIRESGQDPTKRRRPPKDQRTARNRRLAPWRRSRPLDELVPRPTIVPRSLSLGRCPARIDAVTRGSNGRTYLFAEDRVYQSWVEDGLTQKASYAVSEMFAGGPSRVSAVSTNSRSGVTTLFYGRQTYRFRWNDQAQRFHIARNSPQTLNPNITVTPTASFEWDGHQVLVQGDRFITFDAYWNIATYSGQTSNYFPDIPRDTVGIVLDAGNVVLFYTKRNTVQVYDRKKHRAAAELPVSVREYAGCLPS